jgi:hypothetical protein
VAKWRQYKKIYLFQLSFLILLPVISLNAQWARTYGESEREDLAAMKLTSDGGCVAVGWANSFGVPVEDMRHRCFPSDNKH